MIPRTVLRCILIKHLWVLCLLLIGKSEMCNGNNNEPSMFNLTIMCGKFQFKSQSVGPSHEPDVRCISVMLRKQACWQSTNLSGPWADDGVSASLKCDACLGHSLGPGYLHLTLIWNHYNTQSFKYFSSNKENTVLLLNKFLTSDW